MNKRFLFLLILLSNFFVVSCNEENLDDATEVSCTEATGLWTISSATCNGTDSENLSLAYLLFNSTTSVAQTSGNTECASTFNWETQIGSTVPSLDMTGAGNLRCSSNGEEVASCSNEINSCNSQVDITGIINNFSTCVITGESMKLYRTVSTVNNPDSLSYCQDGQDEIVTLTKATDINLDPDPDIDGENPRAILRVVGPNPIDFGSLSVGSDRSMELVINNLGNAPATELSGAGLNTPFQFLGGVYPGTGGTCVTSLAEASTCRVVVEFSPQSVAVFADSLELSYNDGVDPQILSHGVLGAGSNNLGLLIISHGPFYDFGSIQIGNSISNTFTVTNTGGGSALAIQGQSFEVQFSYTGGVYPGVGGTCGASLAAGASCDLEVEFTPDSDSPFNSSIQIQYNDGFFQQTSKRNIFGTGTL